MMTDNDLDYILDSTNEAEGAAGGSLPGAQNTNDEENDNGDDEENDNYDNEGAAGDNEEGSQG